MPTDDIQPDGYIQFCLNGDIIPRGQMYAWEDATEVRAWTPDGTCLGAVTLCERGWYASASDVVDWPSYEDIYYHQPQAALAALLAVSNSHRLIPEAEWQSS